MVAVVAAFAEAGEADSGVAALVDIAEAAVATVELRGPSVAGRIAAQAVMATAADRSAELTVVAEVPPPPVAADSRMAGLRRVVLATPLSQPLLTGNGTRLAAAGMKPPGGLPYPPAQAAQA
jgi:hypothetical protein